MSEIVHIPFHGGEVVAVMNGNKPQIVLKPAIEHIGVDYWTFEQLRLDLTSTDRLALGSDA